MSLPERSIFRIRKFLSFFDLFNYFSQEIGEKNVVIAIDEFPYLIELNKGVVSVFQKIWDELLVNNNLFVSICGSSVGMMETEILGYKSPLYGRRTGEWGVKPLTFRHVKEFFSNYDTHCGVVLHGRLVVGIGGVMHVMIRIIRRQR